MVHQGRIEVEDRPMEMAAGAQMQYGLCYGLVKETLTNQVQSGPFHYFRSPSDMERKKKAISEQNYEWLDGWMGLSRVATLGSLALASPEWVGQAAGERHRNFKMIIVRGSQDHQGNEETGPCISAKGLWIRIGRAVWAREKGVEATPMHTDIFWPKRQVRQEKGCDVGGLCCRDLTFFNRGDLAS
ncbi:hypothetical protein L249_8468, partial [Ophiocordyceps polyrhachis-furcata BCC 54312]